MIRNAIPIALCAVGFVVTLTAFFPLGYADWLPRSVQLLCGVWILLVGLGLVHLDGRFEDER